MSDKDAIHKLCRRVTKAHAEHDATAIVACYAPGALIYNLAPPLASRGMNADEVAAWLATWSSPVSLDFEDLEIVVAEGAAWTTALNRIRGTKTDGTNIDIWFRATMCLRVTGGEWLIVHEHTSTPFYMDGSFKAAVDLRPDRAAA